MSGEIEKNSDRIPRDSLLKCEGNSGQRDFH